MIQVRPTKLWSGDWGIRSKTPLEPNIKVRVTTRHGKTWKVVVDKILWTNGEETVASVRNA